MKTGFGLAVRNRIRMKMFGPAAVCAVMFERNAAAQQQRVRRVLEAAVRQPPTGTA